MDDLAARPTSPLLRDPVDMPLSRVGGKAGALARLCATFDVPPFLVAPPDALVDGRLANPAALVRALRTLGDGPYAVRSSGLEEDGAGAAHAGQFDTELNVAAANVADAIARVWRSGFSETLAQYRRAHGLSDAPQPPAVIVQRMVRATAAGVAFSVDPVSGDRGRVIISAVAGLADKLVGGEVDGDTYVLDRSNAIISAESADAPVLTPRQAEAVADLARRAEAHFGAPQDVEWAFEGERLYLLQSRPITTLAPAAQRVPDDARTIWDNSNIVESYPGLVSPLTFSFARYVYSNVYQEFSRMMGVTAADVDAHRAVFENMLGRIDGRVYYNLINWYRALALFPGFSINRAFMEQMMGVDEPLPAEITQQLAPPGATFARKLSDGAKLARAGLGLLWHDRTLNGTMRQFYRRLADALARPNEEIAHASLSALAAEYRKLEQSLLSHWDAPIINDFLCMIAFGLSRKMLEKWAGAEGLAVHADMLIGRGDIISAELARRIAEMGDIIRGDDAVIAALARADASALASHPALAAAIRSYLEKFGDRCTQELKLESLTLHEDPSALYMAISAAALRPTSVATHAPDASTSLRALFRGKPIRSWLARNLMSWAGARVRNRENLRFERTRLFGRVRRIFLAMGERLHAEGLIAEPRDVFLLTVDEVLGAIEGASVTTDLKALAALRKSERDDSARRPDPPSRIDVRGAHLVGLQQALTATAKSPASSSASADSRTGLACCRGVVTARVRVIDDPRTQALHAGEILVARHTDPGWIAVFANAAGVIAERGSLLSHSAIVAREMNVPCVVSVKNVTQWLRTGDVIRLDGGAGRIDLIERAPA